MPRCRRSLVLRCALLLLFARPVAGQEWTRFRGPNGAGQSDAAGIPTTWGTNDYTWRVALPGIGHSSPVIWGQRVFVTSAIEDDATRIIRCLDTSDGGLIWERKFESTTYEKNSLNSYAAATPAVDQDHVYLSWTTPQEFTLLALDQQKGGLVWRRDLGPYVAQHGSGTSPILFEDLVIVPNEQDSSSAVAVDRLTGQDRWKTDLPVKTGGYATPCIYQVDDGRPQLILAGSEFGLISLDPRSGQKNWQLELFPARVVGSPVVAAGLIFANCGQGGGGKRLVAVRPGTPANGNQPELVYDNKKYMPYVPTPVAYGNLLFLLADPGWATCIDAPTGKIHWQERIGGTYFASPVRVGERIYCVSREGQMVVLAAADKYKLLGRIELGERSQSTPAVAGGVMYVRTASSLMAIGGKKPKPAPEWVPGSGGQESGVRSQGSGVRGESRGSGLSARLHWPLTLAPRPLPRRQSHFGALLLLWRLAGGGPMRGQCRLEDFALALQGPDGRLCLGLLTTLQVESLHAQSGLCRRLCRQIDHGALEPVAQTTDLG